MREKRKRDTEYHRTLPAKRTLLERDHWSATKQVESLENVTKVRLDSALVATRNDEPALNQSGPFLEDEDDSDDNSAAIAMFHSTFKVPRAIAPAPESPVKTVHKRVLGAESHPKIFMARTSADKSFELKTKTPLPAIPYEQLISSRSTTVRCKATRSYYGINIHELLDQAVAECRQTSTASCALTRQASSAPNPKPSCPEATRHGQRMLWTEKYRARKFTDLVGDERTHRDVLRWLKGWDPTVFPGSNGAKTKNKSKEALEASSTHRKILLMAGPPGLGKTTLAHVCAKQAGYEVVEINASDERSKDGVKGRIRDSVGTENVKGVHMKSASGTVRKAGRPVCVVVDEVDGVVTGSSGGGGEGGFIKALIDLVALDQKNASPLGSTSGNAKRSQKGERFRILRPMILICNDVYHPALRPLRSGAIAEIIHIRKPPLDKVVARLRTVFEKEGVACDENGVRRLCEATWGISNQRESRVNSTNSGEGDLRGILVVGEWAASKIRARSASDDVINSGRLTKRWVEQHMLEGLSYGGGSARSLGRGGAKEVVERVFAEGAGFTKSTAAPAPTNGFRANRPSHAAGVSELGKRGAMERLRELVDSSGETDRIVTDCFAGYPSRPFQDDVFLSKPNTVYDWLHFHDSLSSKVFSGQEWELSPYLSQTVLSFHHCFASAVKPSWSTDQKRWDNDNAAEGEEEPLPFSGPRADYEASEAYKQNKTILSGLQSSFSIPLLRAFRSSQDLSVELLPFLVRILTPDVKPVVVGGSGDQRGVVSVRKESERAMLARAVEAMGAVGVVFERGRIEGGLHSRGYNYVYRMEP